MFNTNTPFILYLIHTPNTLNGNYTTLNIESAQGQNCSAPHKVVESSSNNPLIMLQHTLLYSGAEAEAENEFIYECIFI